ncbi:MAG: hypothetical protein HON68_01945 [Gammaproteobacteria bacterium]|nr:hypothetical protein [Gammaproteobacteria bacterium]MBT3717511.1 hypothetical protein [Gammaproteobacteria bacterium]MBT3844699.1 hypothetical protein [Gammaproteobacteria bacterium]MBT3892603.1 hypothetical protein [Gammaproteobacteria bacterium]MBT4301096.1 hypothetical protein [Gammaproteobacteria bacterium]
MRQLKLKIVVLTSCSSLLVGSAVAGETGELINFTKNKLVTGVESSINKISNDFTDQFGDGETEISIQGIDNDEPQYRVTTIQPIKQTADETETLLIQGGLHSGETNNDRRTTLNLGVAKRYLIDDKKAITGVNAFYDYELDSDHSRGSLGAEYKRTNFGITANRYWGLSDDKVINGATEKAIDGYDFHVEGNAPYLPWAKIKASRYLWDRENSSDVKGGTLGVELELYPGVTLEVGNEDSNAMDNSTYGQFTVRLPIEKGKKTHHFIDSVAWKDSGDMSGELMTLVTRSDNIVVETTTSSGTVASSVFTGGLFNGLTYNLVTGAGGLIWLDRNLGASQVCTSATDTACYGDLYQWGRLTDGHEKRDSSTTGNGTVATQSATDVPGHDDYITNGTAWRATANDNLWQGVNGTNNVCPTGFRLPTLAEITTEDAAWATQDSAGAFGSTLKIPMAGSTIGVGFEINEGTRGLYWTSDVHTSNAGMRALQVEVGGNSSNTVYQPVNGLSVRCVRDT